MTYNIPQPEQTAPLFSATDQDGNQVSLGDFFGQWIVLYGCAKPVKGVNEAMM